MLARSLFTAVAVASCGTGASAAMMFDSFADPLPQYTLLSVNGTDYDYAMAFSGTLGNTLHPAQDISQTGLAETLGGQRATVVTQPAASSMTYLYTTDGRGYVYLAPGQSIELEYGRESDLDLDLAATGDVAVEFDVAVPAGSSFAPISSVLTSITLLSARGSGAETSALVSFNLSETEPNRAMFASFAGADLADIDSVIVRFEATDPTTPAYFWVDSFGSTSVPGPGSVSLALIGLGLAVTRRRGF